MENAETARMMLTIPQAQDDELDRLVDQGLYSSKAEAVREALRDFFRDKGMLKRSDDA